MCEVLGWSLWLKFLLDVLKLMVEVYDWSLCLKFVLYGRVWSLCVKFMFEVYVLVHVWSLSFQFWSSCLKCMFEVYVWCLEVYVWIVWVLLRSFEVQNSPKATNPLVLRICNGKVFKANVWNVLRLTKAQQNDGFTHMWWNKCLRQTFGAFGGSYSSQIVAKSWFFNFEVKSTCVFQVGTNRFA